MTEQDLLKLLSHPGALALAVVWLHFRTQRMETRIEMLARHFGAPQPSRPKYRGKILLLLSLASSFVGGCKNMFR